MTDSNKVAKSNGGPKTDAGKRVSSTNARKTSIFTKGYLKDENVEQKQAQMDAFVDQWQAYDPSRQLLLLTIEQAQLGIERMMKAEKLKIEGLMASQTIRSEFCKRAGIDLIKMNDLPAWYFLESGRSEKSRAQYLDAVYLEAARFKHEYSDKLLVQVNELFPNLFDYVMPKEVQNTSFSIALGQQFKQNSPVLNLAALMNHLVDKCKYHLAWSANHEKYQAIIDGLRAEQMLEAMDLEKSTRYAGNFQNRIIKAYAGLAALDQHEQQVLSLRGAKVDASVKLISHADKVEPPVA